MNSDMLVCLAVLRTKNIPEIADFYAKADIAVKANLPLYLLIHRDVPYTVASPLIDNYPWRKIVIFQDDDWQEKLTEVSNDMKWFFVSGGC